MRLGEGVEWALHCCTLLALVPPDRTLPASRLAEYHGIPPAYLAKHLQSLARAGIVESTSGPKGGYRLARTPDRISMLDIVDAIEGDEPAFRCTEIRQRGPAALEPARYRKACGIARAMWEAEDAWREQLRKRTLAHILEGLARDVPVESVAKAADWFQEAIR